VGNAFNPKSITKWKRLINSTKGSHLCH